MRVRVSCSFIALSIVGSLAAGCGIDTAAEPVTDAVPVVGVALDRSFPLNGGLVTNLESHGWPNRDHAMAMDPTVVEARRFYDTLQAPYAQPEQVDYPDPFTGLPSGPRATAPMTFEGWKTAFNIPPREPGESLEAYRARADVVVYYNKNELGLGRELGCAEFDDGVAGDGTQLTGVACYVTNYGTAFRDLVNSLPIAVEGLHAKNTVCITYRPSLPVDYQIQFYTYNGDGLRREWAQLDTLGPRPLPQVCMNCHGGSYDEERHLARHARFLPLDPNVVVFAPPGTPGGVTREAQEERIRKLNLLSTKSPLTPDQHVMLDKLYGGQLATANTKSATAWAPTLWSDSDEHRVLFDQVVKPYCWTCHAAMQTGANGKELAIYSLFESPTLLEAGLPSQLCNAFAMPNSQATRLNFWEPFDEPLTFTDNQTYTSPADLLLSSTGMTRAACGGLTMATNCNRGPDPDALCGNAFSGRACNRETGQCVPDLKAPRGPGEPNGVCKTDGSRSCPFPEKCEASGQPTTLALPGYDGLCIP